MTLTVLMVLLNLSLNGQTPFITELDVSINELTSAQNEKYQKILNQETVVSTKFIDLANLSDAQVDGWLTLTLPDKGCTAEVKAKYVSSYESGDFYWYGEVGKEGSETEEDCECYEGFVNLMKQEGEMIGTISLDEDNYEIQSIGEGRTVLVKKDLSELNLMCGNSSSQGLISSGEQTAGGRSNGSCPVRVLGLYTPMASNSVVNIQSTINLAIEQTNQALRNSQVSECDLELILVDIQEFTFTEGFSIETDLNMLIGNTTLQTIRDAADADIVLVYSNDSYGISGRAGTLHLNKDSSICLIEAKVATTGFTTAHEIAHLFGCRHQLEVLILTTLNN